MQNLKKYAKVVSENAIDEIKNGYINPSPSGNKKPCAYCPYAHICLKDSAGRVFRKSNSVTLESFKEEEYV